MNFYATATIIFDTKFAIFEIPFTAKFRNILTVSTFHRQHNELINMKFVFYNSKALLFNSTKVSIPPKNLIQPNSFLYFLTEI